ncbi:MAG: hypothetical protein HY301_06440 [Verrucomicrobia bacterium]|nr:hypothetical protein [Verrucomicrobiota bacterium]
MKANIAIVILIFLALLLGVALLHVQSTAKNEKHQDMARISDLTTNLEDKVVKLDEQKKVNDQLVSNLAAKIEEVGSFSNKLVATAGELTKTQADAKAAAAAAAAEIAKRDQSIVKLEGERDELDRKMIALNGTLATLNTKIGDTERKLAASEGDREFLLKELKRLQAEKADVEKKFNDLVVLRAQVNKLKDELSAARRLDWFRRGLYGDQPKGGQLMVQGVANNPAASSSTTNSGLNVELRTDGSVRVSNGPTNSTIRVTPK